MNSDGFTIQKIEWRSLIIFAVGILLFSLGAGRFVLRHSFGFMDAFYCCLAVIPAGLLLLVIAYVVQHAIFASVVPLAFAGVLAFSFPVFDVALGLALMGAVVGPALSVWKDEKRLRESAAAHDGESNDAHSE
jgi:uncharacterized MnhB-related membrane protein